MISELLRYALFVVAAAYAAAAAFTTRAKWQNILLRIAIIGIAFVVILGPRFEAIGVRFLGGMMYLFVLTWLLTQDIREVLRARRKSDG